MRAIHCGDSVVSGCARHVRRRPAMPPVRVTVTAIATS
jgi:hypothetical protein